jgi:prepilin-type N-terminal cleavage/methylation domain-containing protein
MNFKSAFAKNSGAFFKMNSNGYTITELLVALTIFSMVILGTIGVLVSAVRLQRDALAMQDMEDNARAVFESMIREMRTGYDYKIVANGKRFCFASAGTSALPAAFIRYHMDNGAIYRRSVLTEDNEYKNCNNNKDGSTAVITSDDVVIDSLDFVLNSDSHKMITVFLKISSVGGSDQKTMNLQTTVSSRHYEE